MLFPTFDFAIFFAIAYTVNWLLNPYSGWWKLSMITLSYVFYGWVGWSYCLLLVATTTLAFVGGVTVSAAQTERRRRRRWPCRAPVCWGCSVGSSTTASSRSTSTTSRMSIGLGRAVPLLQVALPIAISFYTFMALSYVIDIYRRQLQPARPPTWRSTCPFSPSPGRSDRAGRRAPAPAAPQAGPRGRRPRGLAADHGRALQEGGDLVLRLECHRATGVHRSRPHSAPESIFAAWGYAVQIYCDFSGYTDIAIGLALLLGIRFPVNSTRRTRPQPAGLLAALAHHPLALAAGLPLHSARREQRVGGTDRAQHHDHDGARWPVARSGVDLRVLGRTARHRAGGGPRAPPEPGATWSAGGGRGTGPRLGATVPDVPVRLPGVGVLQCQRALRCLRRVGPRLFRLGTASPLVTPLLVLVIVGTLVSQLVPAVRVDRLRALYSRQHSAVQVGVLSFALLGITTFGPAGVAPFIYYRF